MRAVSARRCLAALLRRTAAVLHPGDPAEEPAALPDLVAEVDVAAARLAAADAAHREASMVVNHWIAEVAAAQAVLQRWADAGAELRAADAEARAAQDRLTSAAAAVDRRVFGL